MDIDERNSSEDSPERSVESSVLVQWTQRLAPRRAATKSTGENHSPPEQVATNPLLLSVAQTAMACQFEVLQNRQQYPQGVESSLEALQLIEKVEQLFSVYKPHSDLSRINRFAHLRPQCVSLDSFTLLQLAQDMHLVTQGAFDITAGSLSEAWGFSRRRGIMPSQSEIEKALQNVGSTKLHLDISTLCVTTESAGVTVNPGGIGKGYALDRAANLLAESGIDDFMIHGGLSSIVARGNRMHSATRGGWLVAVKHPWDHDRQLGNIRLCNAALGTSGSGKQFFHFQGKRYSHLIDPRTGWPAQSMMSSTVLCASGAIADALATALFVLGPTAAREFCEQHPEIGALLVYASPQTGKLVLEAINLPKDVWIPNESVS
ncbi:MAG: FAD:protein FMN transferase [Planctomycetales bacterium]|nr:FAD:protein FMN transferase [Planctomycetales bacterium]